NACAPPTANNNAAESTAITIRAIMVVLPEIVLAGCIAHAASRARFEVRQCRKKSNGDRGDNACPWQHACPLRSAESPALPRGRSPQAYTCCACLRSLSARTDPAGISTGVAIPTPAASPPLTETLHMLIISECRADPTIRARPAPCLPPFWSVREHGGTDM